MLQDRSIYLNFFSYLCFRQGKMAFVAGPRQVGKTFLTELLIQARGGGYYHTWDDVVFKRQWMQDPKQLVPDRPGQKPLVVFDELHKAPRWKSSLKGVYDLRKKSADIVVTGSARLDVFRKGGDSLLGRYYLMRLHPFSLGEVSGGFLRSPDSLLDSLNRDLPEERDLYERLLTFGGFPEPFLKSDPTVWNLWKRTRLERIIREDIFDVAKTHEIALLESCAALVPTRVGSLFSYQSLSEDLSVSPPTIRRWIDWLSQLYYLYAVSPYAKTVVRSLRKQPKVYLWDWSEVPDQGAKFENLVAGHLLKACHYWTDMGLGLFEMNYVRDKEKREVDFLITRDRKPWILVEVKLADTKPSPHLKRFADVLNPAVVLQIIGIPGIHERMDVGKGRQGFLSSASKILRLF